jgi:hypothetical protein
VRTIHWPKVIASAWPLSIIPADHRAFLLTVRNRPWTQIRRASPPFGAAGRLFNVIAKMVQNGLICQVERVERVEL